MTVSSAVSIVSWNVNSIKSRLTHLSELLTVRKPNIVCLQELKCTDETFPFEEIRALGYECAVYGQKTYNGVAVLSRRPIDSVVYGFDGVKGESSARLICATIGKLKVYSVYVPNGQEVGSEKYKEKLLFFKSLQNCLSERHQKNDSVVLGGDFNVAQEDLDVHDPQQWRGKILFSDRERKALSTVSEWGLIDTYRHLYKMGKDFSWWDYRAGAFPKNEGLRIDMLFASAPLAAKLSEAGVYREFRRFEKPSDHAPVFASFLP